MSPSEAENAPRDHPKPDTPPVAQAPTVSERARHRLEHINESLEAGGLTVHGFARLLVWWKRIGLGRALGLLVAFGVPAGGYSTLLYSASRSIPDWVGDFGVRFDAKETHIDLFHLSVAARDVTVKADARSEPVFRATEVVFDGSLSTLFAGLFGPGAFYNEITIRQGELHLERSLTGDWNVEEFVARVPQQRRDAALAGLYRIHGLYLENFKVVYTEHVPGDSGGGVIQTAQATIYVDDVNGWVLDLAPSAQPGDRPTRYEFKGRSADGIVQIKGTAGLFGNQGDSGGAGGIRKASTNAAPPEAVAGLEGATYQMNVYLENIGLGAYARMVPTTRLLPTRGSLRGTVDVERSPAAFVCKSNMGAENLEFAPNPRLVVVKEQFDRLQKDLAGFRASGPFDPCGGEAPDPRQPRDSANTMTAVLASFNAQTTHSAPPAVRAFAAADQQQIAGVVAGAAMTEMMNKVTGKVSSQVTQLVGQKAGLAIQKSLGSVATPSSQPAASSGSGGNPVTKGVKGIGSGFKRLFGGGDKKDTKKPPSNQP